VEGNEMEETQVKTNIVLIVSKADKGISISDIANQMVGKGGTRSNKRRMMERVRYHISDLVEQGIITTDEDKNGNGNTIHVYSLSENAMVVKGKITLYGVDGEKVYEDMIENVLLVNEDDNAILTILQ
jgi:predicted ArsR family transcriptional regulator